MCNYSHSQSAIFQLSILQRITQKTMTHRKTPTSASNHRTKSPKSPENLQIPKSPEPHSRIFTEKDEIQLLKTLSKSPNSTDLHNPNFTSAQISKKLKRLKEKYHKLARTKSLIKTPHDSEIYELGRTIWGRRNAAAIKVNNNNNNLEDFSFLMNEMKEIFERNGDDDGYFKEGLRRLGNEKLKEMNEKWMELRLEESQLMVNRAKLYHENLKCVVEVSKGSH